MTSLTEKTVEALRRRLRGPLLFPDHAGFEEATLLWNGMIEKTPALVVQPADTADVMAAVDLARSHDLAISVRAAGHNIAGTALADGGLTIDMSRLRRPPSIPRRAARPPRSRDAARARSASPD